MCIRISSSGTIKLKVKKWSWPLELWSLQPFTSESWKWQF